MKVDIHKSMDLTTDRRLGKDSSTWTEVFSLYAQNQNDEERKGTNEQAYYYWRKAKRNLIRENMGMQTE